MSFFSEPNPDAMSVPREMAAQPPSARSGSPSFDVVDENGAYVLIAMVVVISAGMMLGRAAGIVARNGVVSPYATPRWFALIGLAANLSALALIVFSFFQMPWHLPILMVVTAAVMSGLLVSGRNAVGIFKATPVLGMAIILSAIGLAWLLWD